VVRLLTAFPCVVDPGLYATLRLCSVEVRSCGVLVRCLHGFEKRAIRLCLFLGMMKIFFRGWIEKNTVWRAFVVSVFVLCRNGVK